ncbi:unnamed protein product [Mycena citricolor]|uniref:Xylose isomerase-like TIM barrel domain-containing protein n=1 Tax=Mycena citricolor TaxID=2018698 RepID=A0AAD2HFW6_9AGAR|nr:unnamed protein product [Mycena citricolor]
MSPKFAISTLSLGTNLHHDLPTKIRVAAEQGYDGVEIFVPDFEAFVEEVAQGRHQDLLPRPLTDADDREIECAKAIGALCTAHGLSVPVFQPMRNFENFDSPRALGGGGLPAALAAAERYIRLMPHLKTNLLLVCSNFIEPEDHPYSPYDPEKEPLPSFTHASSERTVPPGPAPSTYYPALTQAQLDQYLDTQVAAFRELGKVAARYGVRVGYEGLAWGTVVDNWEQVWDVVRRVGRDNVGIILDSFNLLGNEYADPTVPSTFLRAPESISPTPVPAAGPPLPAAFAGEGSNPTHKAVLQNLAVLARTIPAHKIFLYQVADGAAPCEPPATIPAAPRAPARMTWSRASRLFPCEEDRGAWLPVVDMSLAITQAGYPSTRPQDDGAWWSLEVFNRSLSDSRPECVEEHGARGIAGLRTLWDRVSKRIKAECEEPPSAVL